MHTISQFIGTINARAPPQAGKSPTLCLSSFLLMFAQPRKPRTTEIGRKREGDREREGRREGVREREGGGGEEGEGREGGGEGGRGGGGEGPGWGGGCVSRHWPKGIVQMGGPKG